MTGERFKLAALFDRVAAKLISSKTSLMFKDKDGLNARVDGRQVQIIAAALRRQVAWEAPETMLKNGTIYVCDLCTNMPCLVWWSNNQWEDMNGVHCSVVSVRGVIPLPLLPNVMPLDTEPKPLVNRAPGDENAPFFKD